MVQWENSRENVLLAENSNLEQKTKEEQLIRRRLEFQLETAQVFQKLLLPSPLVHEEISSCFFYAPAEKIGGDWFTYLLDEREEVFYTIIIDVTGHGLVSAMLASFLSGIVAAHFEDNIATKDSALRLKILSEKINRVLFSSSAQSGMAATGLLLAVDKNQGSIFYINCGHPPILIKQESTFEIIPSSGRRLGIVRESDFEVQRIPLLGDGRLFTYTDGLIDNCSDHPFKMSSRHLKKLLDKTVELNVEDAKHLLQSHFENHFEKSLENDDATFILIDWNLANKISEESPPDVPPGEHKDQVV
ncbi:serine/threonine-protein phosphatase [bacterium]|nr:serine/threonine-protein phosphatase [bacterium]